jgi:glycerol uptake facilitator-like aquaporin
MSSTSLARRSVAEGIGTAFLLATVIGSGIMGDKLAGGNVAVALLANTLATGAALVALILSFGPVSGANFNPAVTLVEAAQGARPWREVFAYVLAQILGGFAGVGIANLMFDKPVYFASTHERSGPSQLLGELVATYGLIVVIGGCARVRASAVPFAVGAYITAAYWFTSSTSFANPAVTLARSASDTFAGIRPVDVPGFVVAQLFGAAAAAGTVRWLLHSPGEIAEPAAKTVLFACIHNAGRSQMSAAWFNRLVDPAKAHAISAGTEPGVRVHPEVVDVMREQGVDLAEAVPQRLTEDLAASAAILVTMGCGEECPVVPGVERVEWLLEDPKGKAVERVREIRDEIERRVRTLLGERGWAKARGASSTVP